MTIEPKSDINTLEHMTVTEIRHAMAVLVAAMAEKAVVTPSAGLTINDGSCPHIHISGAYDTTPFDGEGYRVFFGEGCIEKATAYIAAMPAPETAHLHTYMRKLADAVDYGHQNGVAAEYVDPVRITQKAMSDNLLGVVK